ncbi:hypothetical protein GXP70_22265 [Paenibacillus lycopersici]|uniref:Uncharacterized protein n=1 Tax=Paenibacillus lycopersici TaxID=2704462 RepID=A0A6C0FZA3_9BACL|nr:hypothetical protein [Paenibacillus lycopersici]QHT62436.1 hypothetical protein GXP70_22265 [Paenibacillus lycopersici]
MSALPRESRTGGSRCSPQGCSSRALPENLKRYLGLKLVGEQHGGSMRRRRDEVPGAGVIGGCGI